MRKSQGVQILVCYPTIRSVHRWGLRLYYYRAVYNGAAWILFKKGISPNMRRFQTLRSKRAEFTPLSLVPGIPKLKVAKFHNSKFRNSSFINFTEIRHHRLLLGKENYHGFKEFYWIRHQEASMRNRAIYSPFPFSCCSAPCASAALMFIFPIRLRHCFVAIGRFLG